MVLTPAARGLIAASARRRRLPDDDEERGRRAHLRRDRAPRGAGDAGVEPVDEQHLESEVERARGDRDTSVRLRVLHPAEVSGARECDEHERCAEQADAEVRECERSHRRRRSHHIDDDRGEEDARNGEDDTEAGREPETVDALLGCRPEIAGAELAGDRAGRGVGQEVEDAEDGGEDDARDREPAERPDPEAADDRGVGQEVQRLGDERSERRDRQAHDLPVVHTAQGGQAEAHHLLYRRSLVLQRSPVAELGCVGGHRRFVGGHRADRMPGGHRWSCSGLWRRCPSVVRWSTGGRCPRASLRYRRSTVGRGPRASGLVVPAFRSPPRVRGASRTLKRYPGGAVVSVKLRERTYADVVDDMIDGVLVANRVGPESRPRLRQAFQLALGEVEIDLTKEEVPPPTLATQARVAERQTQAA